MENEFATYLCAEIAQLARYTNGSGVSPSDSVVETPTVPHGPFSRMARWGVFLAMG